uniref:CRAL-TRIO domain-containing protein n=1 Tax=Proboscia inermis TaxID=420281 RepID=A0A7S0CFW1_9STRA|mmetsp:Transcript_46274/g.46741  ORF Transcript_46274/g.46741 Transcript_46274/m.46741 type:complete len:334 (+) Transcript_46274:138-1139(+)
MWINQLETPSTFRQSDIDTLGYDINTFLGEQLFVGAHVNANKDIIRKVVKGDFITYDRSIALDHLYGFIHEDKLRLERRGPRSREKALKWEFRRSLHRHFDKTLDDVLRSFLAWATVKVEKNGALLINVSRAFRRIDFYSDWLESEGHLLDELLSLGYNHMRSLRNKCKRHLQYNYDETGRVLFWADFSADVLVKMEEHLTMHKRFQLFVWTVHEIMFDSNAQIHGVIAIRYMAFISPINTTLQFKDLETFQKLIYPASSIKIVFVLAVRVPLCGRIFWGLVCKYLYHSLRNLKEYREDNGIEVLKKLQIAQHIPEDYGDYNVRNRKRNLEEA